MNSLGNQIRGSGANKDKLRTQVRQMGAMANNFVDANRKGKGGDPGATAKKVISEGTKVFQNVTASV